MVEKFSEVRGKILVTGGAGFIGSAVVRRLLRQPDVRIVNVDKLTYAANLASIPQVAGHVGYCLETVDICNGPELRRIFDQYEPDAVVNLAAESHVDRSIDGPGAFVQTNIIGTFTLLQESLRYWRGLARPQQQNFRLLHVSTDEVYGSLSDEGFFTETSSYAPNSPYSATKASSDHLVRAWRETYGLPTLITNCSNNYGPYQFPEKLIPLMIISGLDGKPLPVYGDGLNIRDWLFVDDHVDALLRVLQHGAVGETYNIGSRSERTNLSLVELICDLLDDMVGAFDCPRRALISFVSDRPGHDRRYAIDPGKLENDLGWLAAESFETGLIKTVRWYVDNRAWWANILEGGYQLDRRGVTAEWLS